MLPNFRTALVTLVGLAAPLAAQGTVAGPQSMLPYLPKGTLMAVSAPDLDASMGEFAQMPLSKIWHEEEVQAFFRDAMDAMQEQIDLLMDQGKLMHEQGAMPLDPTKLTSLRIHGATFAITRLAMADSSMMPLPDMGVMLHLDFGSSSEQWYKLMRMGVDMMLMQVGGEMDREDAELAGGQMITLSPTNAPPELRMGINLAMVNNGLIIGTLKDEVLATVEAMAAGTPVLTAESDYKNNARHLLTEGAEVEMFMRPNGFLDFMLNGMEMGMEVAEMSGGMAPPVDLEGLRRAMEEMGLFGIESFGSTSTYVDGKAITKGYAVSPAPQRKGILAGMSKNLDTAFLRWVPKDATSFSASAIDPMSIYDALSSAMQAYNEDFAKMMFMQLEQMEQQIGFSLRQDLFGALGDTAIYWSMPMASMMSTPETSLLVKVNDEEKIVKVLRILTEMSDGAVELEEATRRGVKTFQLRVNIDPMQGAGMNPLDMFNPSFSFKDGYMVAAFSPSDIRRTFKRMERGEDADPKSDIRGNKEFSVYMEDLPKQLQSLSFTDWKAGFESSYQMLTSVLSLVPMNEDVPLDMSMLPDSTTMTKHLFGSISYSQSDGLGMSSTSISPIGPEVMTLVPVVVAVVAGAVAFRMAQER